MKSKLILFDLDGTIYLSGKVYPGVLELFDKLRDSSLEFGFLTNNSSIGPEDYYQKMKNLGFQVEPRNIISSCEATCLMLKGMHLGPKIYMLGTEKFRRYMESQGFVHSFEDAEALLLATDLELDYRKLQQATHLVLAGKPIVATHPDPICPGEVPDAGMLIEFFKAVKPGTIIQAIAGKPHHWLVEMLEERFQVRREEIIMVGDRMDTDIQFAYNFGMRSMLVLNGEPMPMFGHFRPTVIVPETRQIAEDFWPGRLGWL